MADPVATARQWLADTMCADLDIDLDKPSCRRCLEKADAIVADIEVTTILWPIDGSRRVALLLPAEEGTGT